MKIIIQQIFLIIHTQAFDISPRFVKSSVLIIILCVGKRLGRSDAALLDCCVRSLFYVFAHLLCVNSRECEVFFTFLALS